MLNITGKTRVYRNDEKGFPIFSIGVGMKDMSGEWHNGYFEAKFKKGIDLPQNKTDINITDGFLSFREYESDGKTRKVYLIVVMSYEVVAKPAPTTPGFKEIPNDDIPF